MKSYEHGYGWEKLGIFKSVRIDARITLSSCSFTFKLILNRIGLTLD